MSDATGPGTGGTTGSAGGAGAGRTTGEQGIAMNETERLIASDKVEGTAVYNRQGEAIGSIYTLMIDKRSGQVDYAVIGFGGFLGIGERYHPVPWKALYFDPRVGGYVADVTRGQLERAPSYASDEAPWDNPGYGRSIYDYYGMTYPYGGI
jgi:sporulation protein YlmC with PRC-barrel domain